MCKELKMAPEESLCHSLQASKTAQANEHMMSQAPLIPAVSTDDHNAGVAAAPAALDHNEGGAAAASDMNCTSQRQCAASIPIIAGPVYNSIDRSVTVMYSSDTNPSQIPTNDADHSNSSPATHLPPQLKVLALDHDHYSVVLQDDQISSITIALSPGKKVHARCSSAEKEEEEDEEGGEEEGYQEKEEDEEEEGCATPTAREQRISHFNKELVCPPAPKKKPCASKRRRLFHSADDHGAVNYHIVAEQRPFFVDPPDLHNFPDCIRALFK